MDCIIAESDRLTKLLKQFLQFSSNSFGPTEEVKLGPVLQQVLSSVSNHPDWRGDIKVEVSKEVAAMRVMGHRDALSQVFFNLIINSSQVQAPNCGRVKIIKVPEPRGHTFQVVSHSVTNYNREAAAFPLYGYVGARCIVPLFF